MKLIFLAFICVFAVCVDGFSQQKKGVKKEGAHQAEYNSNTEERDHSADIDSRNPAQDNSGENTHDAGEQEANENDSDADSESNTEGVNTQTTSSGGSPGIDTDDNTLDGTNTMQSAQPNIAGSPIPGSARAAKLKKQNEKATPAPGQVGKSGEKQDQKTGEAVAKDKDSAKKK